MTVAYTALEQTVDRHCAPARHLDAESERELAFFVVSACGQLGVRPALG